VAEVLVDAHSWLRWAVLAVLFLGGGYALVQAPRDVEFSRGPFSVAVAVVDLQVLLGVVLYVWNAGWTQGWFVAIVHPIAMIAAAGIVHAGVGKAAGEESTTRAYQLVGVAFLVALAVVTLGIPWERTTV
jgi:hypothetical protein